MKHIFKSVTAVLLAVMLLIGSFPLTALAEEEEPREPVQLSWVYTQSTDAQVQGGEMPHGFMLDDENPTVSLRFPPMRATGKRFLGWSGLPEQAQLLDSGFTVLDLNRDDFTINEDGSLTSPYRFSTTLSARFESGTTVTFNGNGGKLNGMTKWIEELSGSGIDLSRFVAEWDGYVFTGWSDQNGNAVAALDGLTADAVGGGSNYALTATWQRADGFDYLYDENTKTLTVATDRGMTVFSDELTEAQLNAVERLVMLDGVTKLPQYTSGFRFSQMTALKALVISPSFKRIDSNYFSEIASLEQVSIPTSVLNIRTDAFANCTKLEEVSFGDNDADPLTSMDMLSIENEAFKNCAVSEIHFPRQLLKLGARVFAGCPLKDVYFQEARFRVAQYMSIEDTGSSASGSFDLAGTEVVLHFPESIAEMYKTTVIPNYADIINPPEGFHRYPVSVNGETFSSSKLQIACGDGYAEYDPQTYTLTLNNAVISKGNVTANYAAFDGSDMGINAACDELHLVLQGENSLAGDSGDTYYDPEQDMWIQGEGGANGIEIKGDLTVTGSGSLTMDEAENAPMKTLAAYQLTIDGAAVHMSGGIVSPRGNTTIKNSKFSFGEFQIPNAVSVTFQNSDVAMNGRLAVYTGEASIVFDGGDFTGTAQGDLLTGYADTDIFEYRGDIGILSGGWYGKGSIHIGTMETVTDETTGVKLGNLGGASYTVTALDADQLSRAEALLQKNDQYTDYYCAFGYEITVDPTLTEPMTVFVPATTAGVLFTCTEGDDAAAKRILSSTADGYCRFTTDSAGKFFFAVVGQASEYEMTITGVLPDDAAPTVTLTYSNITEELSLNGDNGYTAHIDNSHEAVVTVSASGYQTQTFRRAKGSSGSWNLGTITLLPIPSSGVIMTSIRATDGRGFTGFDGLHPVITDEKKTLVEGTDYTLSYPYILLSTDYVKSASANGSLTLTLTPDDSMALASGTAETTLKALAFGVMLTAWGKAEIAVSSGFVSFNHILLFNREGALVESGTAYGGKTYVSKALAEGTYTAVGFNSNTRFSSFGSLADLNAARLAAGEDYASASFSVQNGKTAKASLAIPTLKITETETANRASLSLHPGTVVLGAAFRVKVDYSLAQEPDGNIVVTLPDDSEVVYISEGSRIYLSAQVYDAEAHTVTVPANGTEGSLLIGMYVTEPGVHSVNAALSSGGRMTPLAGLSFNPAANVRVMAPQNTDSKGFTASLRGTANSQLKVELNGKPYATVTTNAAGSASVKIEIPADVFNGDILILRAYDNFGEDVTKVNYYQKDATRLASLTAQYNNGTIGFVKNGVRVKNPHYSVLPTDYSDWWTLTAVLFGAPAALDTGNVSAQIMLSNGDFHTVQMTLTDSGVTDGEQRYVFKGMYFQNGYNNKPLPVNISLQYADKIDPVFIADTENRLDYESLAGNREFLDSLDELNEESEQQLALITNQSKAQELIDSFRQSEAYQALTKEQQNAYNAAADSYQAPADEPFDMNDLLFDNVKISETEEFNDYSPEEQTLILSMEKNTQDYIDAFSAFYKLKKPMNEYEDMAEIWREIGYTVTENYTAAPGKEYMQMDKAVWYYYDEENNITSVIDTEKHVRADVDYGKMERRNEEITEKLSAAFGIENSKVGEPLGDDGDGDLSVDKAYEYIKDRVEHQDDIEIANLLADYSNSAYEYFASDMLERTQNFARSKLDGYKETQSINYEKFLAEELAAGGDGSKALQQSEHGVKYIAQQEKLANGFNKAATGLDYLGDALAAWEIYKHNEDMNDCDEMIKQFNRVEDALWNSKLPYEDKLTLLRDGEEYVEAVMKLKGISRHERDSNIGQLTFSVANKIFENPILNIGLNVAGVAVPALDNYKNELIRPSLEQTVQMKERRLLQLLEKAKRLETEDKKNQLDQQHIPYDDNIDLDFGIDIPPEVAEWYYEARMEEAQKRGIDVQPIMDPSGIVYEALEDNVLEGVTATVWYSPIEDGSKAVIWNAADYDQENPLLTGLDGSYAWDVPQGYWQVRFEKDGYEPAQTEWLPVPPPQLHIKTPMISAEKPQIAFAVAYPDFIEIEFSQYMDTSRLPNIEGYEAEWTEAQTAHDGKELSKTLRLIPRNGVTPADESISVDIDGVRNYAGTALESCSLTMTVTARPDRINISENVQIVYGYSTTVTVQVIGADQLPMKNVTVTAVSNDPSVVLQQESAVTDNSGKAVWTLTGADIGCAALTFAVDSTNVSADTQAVVLAADVLIGDVDGNGSITISDVTAIQRHIAEFNILTGNALLAADTNGDGVVDINDATLLQKYLAEFDVVLGKQA